MKKKYIFIALAVLALASGFFIFIKIRQAGQSPTVTPRRPDIPDYVTGKLPIEILVKKEDFNFPSQLPTLSVSKRGISKENALAFSGKLGFTENVEEFEDVNEGVKYYTSNDKYFFIATPKTSVVKYGLSTSEFPQTANKRLTDEELTNISLKFLTENNFYSESQIKALSVSYYKKSAASEGLEKTDRGSAELFQVDFILGLSDYEILTSRSTNPLVFVQILPDGEIYNSEILLAGGLQKGITEYPLKTYEDLTSSLDEAKLITLSGDYISLSDLTTKEIENLEVEKIRLVYLLEEGKENILQPIYVLEGPAKILSSTANYASIYIPAYK